MFEFDVEIEGDIWAVDFVAAIVGAGEVFLDFYSESSILFAVFEFVQFEIFVLEGLIQTKNTSNF